MLAMKHSLRAVKADAAAKVFSIQCNEITWAVIDCGIDASHPVFLDRSKFPNLPPDNAPPEDQQLSHSRVIDTYDFTALPELLLGEKLPAHYTTGVPAPAAPAFGGRRIPTGSCCVRFSAFSMIHIIVAASQPTAMERMSPESSAPIGHAAALPSSACALTLN